MKNFRTEIIEAVKGMNITAQELGFKDDDIKWQQAWESSRRDYYDLLNSINIFIQEQSDKETARNYFDECLWEDLGIDDKKYKIVRVTLTKQVSTEIEIIMPEDVELYNAEDYIENMEYIEPTEEEDWEIDDYREMENDLTEEHIKDNYSEEELWNYNEFTEQ